MSFRLDSCELCPRRCRANRRRQDGRCGAGTTARVYRYGLHHGEEPPLSAGCGSGTIFFSHCPLSCLYCQNWPWSQENRGELHTVSALTESIANLARAGACNLNLVAPTPWLPMIRSALEQADHGPASLPVVYNTSGYERVETLREFEGLANVYLADLRYASPASASEGSDAADYVETARAAVLEMWRQAGPLQTDSDGIARSGVIVRLLLLPGREHEAEASLRWLYEQIGPEMSVSLMAQYPPAWKALDHPAWNRPVDRAQYERLCELVADLGFEGWMQDADQPASNELIGFNMPAGPGHRA